MNPVIIRFYAFLFCILIAGVSEAQIRGGEIVRIKNISSGKYMVPASTNSSSGAQLVIGTLRTEPLFNWRVVALQSGGYQFFNQQNNMVLCISGESRLTNAAIIQQADNLPASSVWTLVKTTRGFKIKSKLSEKIIAVENAGTANNAKLLQSLDNSGPDKEWQFEIAGSGTPAVQGKKVLYDLNLNYIAVSEATRNRIDNGDCRRIFGQISTELWELDENNEMKTRISSYNNMPEIIYQQSNYSNPPTAGLSYYQDKLDASSMGKVTYNIPEELLKKRKVMLVVKTNLGTRHKDNDFASYDALRMKEEIESTYILDTRTSRTETIQSITDLSALSQDMHLTGYSIPSNYFQRTDDAHKIWVRLSFRKK